MWNLLTNRKNKCSEVQDVLEEAAETRPQTMTAAELQAALSPAQRAHLGDCAECGDAAESLIATRGIFQGVPSYREEAAPWFAGRVMAAIEARERQLARAESSWSAVPRFASRLTWVTAIVLLAGSTWLIEKPAPELSKIASVSASQEYLFDAPPPPVSKDDVLVSMAEANR